MTQTEGTGDPWFYAYLASEDDLLLEPDEIESDHRRRSIRFHHRRHHGHGHRKPILKSGYLLRVR